ncbi:MAG: hypothetical protein QXP34_03125 [Candidatus Aenigmatarchaeota archaeon]
MTDLIIGLSFFFLTFLLILGILRRLNIFSNWINFVISFSVAFYSFLLFNYYNLFSQFLAFMFLALIFFIFAILIYSSIILAKREWKEEKEEDKK